MSMKNNKARDLPESQSNGITTTEKSYVEHMPSQWREPQITAIFEKEEWNKCENYRGIRIQARIGRISNDKRESGSKCKRENREDQAGFTAGWSSLDHIHTIQ